MHVGVHLGDSHFELAPLDLQLVTVLGELQFLDFLLRDAAGCVRATGETKGGAATSSNTSVEAEAGMNGP